MALMCRCLGPLVLLVSAALCGAHSEFRSLVPNGMNIPGTAALGHAQVKGGGNLNVFGRDFKAAGYRWTRELCMMDSDGDGESNGLELGDPCCEWKEGDIPRRTWRTSHPGCGNAQAPVALVVCMSGIPLFNCSEALSARESLPQLRDAKSQVDEQNVEEGHFWNFYLSDQKDLAKSGAAEEDRSAWGLACSLAAFVSGRRKRVVGLSVIHSGSDAATWVVLAELSIGLLLTLWERRRTARSSAGRKAAVLPAPLLRNNSEGALGKHGGGCGPLSLPRSSLLRHLGAHALLILGAAFTIDLGSALIHLVFDNPAINGYGYGIGSTAVSFQHHHHDPAGVTRGELFDFLRENHILVAILCAPIVLPSWCSPVSPRVTPWFRLFLFWTCVLAHVEALAHRWSHTLHTRLSPAALFMQEWGVVMNHRHHALHHVDYIGNFALFTGWVNPTLNVLTERLLSPTSQLWAAPFAFVLVVMPIGTFSLIGKRTRRKEERWKSI